MGFYQKILWITTVDTSVGEGTYIASLTWALDRAKVRVSTRM